MPAIEQSVLDVINDHCNVNTKLTLDTDLREDLHLTGSDMRDIGMRLAQLYELKGFSQQVMAHTTARGIAMRLSISLTRSHQARETEPLLYQASAA